MRGMLLVVATMALLACGSVAKPVLLTPDARNVRTGRNDPPASYVELGPVSAAHGHGCGGFGKVGNYAGALASLRNNAAAMGATYVRIDKITEPHRAPDCFVNAFVILGMAFRPAP